MVITECFRSFYGRGFYSGMMHTGGGLWMVLGLVLIVVAALFFMSIYKKGKKETNDDALQALKMRFAKGEITEEEFDKMKRTLS